MSEKTVFISYRRDATGRAFARSLKQELTHRGYDVFLDVDCVDAGQWAAQIITQVPARAHFLLRLTPGALDRCAEEDDWVRREFLSAMEHGRNIVPVREESVDLAALRAASPPSVKAVFGFQIATVRHGSFESDIGMLVTRYIPPHKAPVATASPPSACAVDISRILKYAPAELIGREAETKLLSDAWNQAVRGENKRPHLLTFVALGGEGKTSLVAKWAADLAHRDWPGCDAVFAWSFYSQGTREQTAVSSDLFLAEALTFFGDAETAGSAKHASEKGKKLAELVGGRRALLILDGLEPLQHPSTATAFKPGALKDEGIAKLLKDLAANSRGLCIVTTRIEVPELQTFKGGAVHVIPLPRLSRAAGVQLLKAHGVTGSDRRNIPLHDGDAHGEKVSEFEMLVEEVKGHALTLNLLGTYLRDAHAGDIRKRGLIKLEEADAEEQGGHAFHVMDAYVRWLESSPGLQPATPPEGRTPGAPSDELKLGTTLRALAILRLMGLFDRPATADCLDALWRGEAIAGLTEPLTGLSDAQRNLTLKRLEDAKLLTVNRAAGSGDIIALDAHPLLREYFARRVREQQPEAWRAAHRRLYEHLCASTHEGDQPTLEALQPLYQAVAHGCQAGLQQEACEKVYRDRIQRGEQHYSAHKLGAVGSDMGAIARFFEPPWSRVSPALIGPAQAWLLNEAAFRLRALGRLTESLEPMRAGLEMGIKQENWKQAAVSASNLSELELTLGKVAEAVGDAEQSVTYADRSGDAQELMEDITAHADALHQTGRRAEAEARFREAEQMQAAYPLLYSVRGFKYCDLLLTEAERAAWQRSSRRKEAHSEDRSATSEGAREGQSLLTSAATSESCRAVSERAAQTLKWYEQNKQQWLLDIALDHLTLGRAALYAAILGNFDLRTATLEIDHAVSGLRRAGSQHHIPRALLSRAWQRSLTGSTDSTGSASSPQAASPQAASGSAQSDLDEAWEIAERGPMPLFLADIHLHRARLFFRETPYPWNQHPDGTPRGPADDLAAARRLIEKHGYWRRKEELEDAEAALLN